ncbi:hypothetical protein AKO1_007071, partial [Acrasis kona]
TKAKALFFGIDGLVSNINQIRYTVWQRALQGYGYNLTFHEYLQLFLFENPLSVLIPLLPYNTSDEHQAVMSKREDYLVELLSSLNALQLHLCIGIHSFIQQVKSEDEQVKIVAVSDLSIRETTQLLETLNLHMMFDCVISSYGLEKCKPSAIVYKVALEKLNLGSEDVFVFEGTQEGVISAHSAGLKVVGIKPNLPESQEDAAEKQRSEIAMIMMNEHALLVVDNLDSFKLEYLEHF